MSSLTFYLIDKEIDNNISKSEGHLLFLEKAKLLKKKWGKISSKRNYTNGHCPLA